MKTVKGYTSDHYGYTKLITIGVGPFCMEEEHVVHFVDSIDKLEARLEMFQAMKPYLFSGRARLFNDPTTKDVHVFKMGLFKTVRFELVHYTK